MDITSLELSSRIRNRRAPAGLTSRHGATTLGRDVGGDLAQMSSCWTRYFVGLGAVFGLLSVVAGAWGVHALRDTLDPGALNTFQTAARFQMYHSLALVLTGLLVDRWPSWMLVAAGWLFTAGLVVFCGSLYILALTGIGFFGAVAPVGGASLMGGWGLLIWSVFTRSRGG